MVQGGQCAGDTDSADARREVRLLKGDQTSRSVGKEGQLRFGVTCGENGSVCWFKPFTAVSSNNDARGVQWCIRFDDFEVKAGA